MKLEIQQDVLLKALLHTTDVVERRTTVPILSHVLLEASADQTLTLMGTDLEVSLVEKIPATVQEAGKTTVSGYLLREIVRKYNAQDTIQLTLDAAEQRLQIVCNQSKMSLSTLPAQDFPSLQAVEFSFTFAMSRAQLKKLIDQTAFAMATEGPRYHLNGIYFHVFSAQELRAVATDGHRMARARIALPEGAENMPGVIISRKTVNELVTILRDLPDDEMMTIALSATLARFQVKDIMLTARLVDGAFPDYERVIPIDNKKSMLVPVSEFARAVDRVAILAEDKTRGVKLHVDNGLLRFSVEGNEMGSANDAIPIDYQSDPIQLGFNATYLLDVAKVLQEDAEAEILMSDERTAIMIRQHENQDALYVIMPMRI